LRHCTSRLRRYGGQPGRAQHCGGGCEPACVHPAELRPRANLAHCFPCRERPGQRFDYHTATHRADHRHGHRSLLRIPTGYRTTADLVHDDGDPSRRVVNCHAIWLSFTKPEPEPFSVRTDTPDQRRCRLYTVFQLPYYCGRSRHAAPALVRHNTPSQLADDPSTGHPASGSGPATTAPTVPTAHQTNRDGSAQIRVWRIRPQRSTGHALVWAGGRYPARLRRPAGRASRVRPRRRINRKGP